MSNGRLKAPPDDARAQQRATSRSAAGGRRLLAPHGTEDVAQLCFDALRELLSARRDVLAAERHIARRAAVERHVAALDELQRLARELGPYRDADGIDPLTAQRIAAICDIARVQPIAAAARTSDEMYRTAAELNAAIELARRLDALSASASPRSG